MISWYPIESVPNADIVVLFYVPGKTPTIEMAQNYYYLRNPGSETGGAHWLDGATHWAILNTPGKFT